MKKALAIVKIIPLLLAMLSISGCQTDAVDALNKVSYKGLGANDPVLVQTIEVRGKYTKVEMSKNLVKVASHRGWEIKSQSEDEVVMYLNHRGNESTLTWRISESGYKVYSVSYELTKNGKRKKRSEPDGWIRNLHKDLKRVMSGVN